MALAVMLLGAIAAPAVSAPAGTRTEAPALAPIEIERFAVHARVGEWDAPRPVLIPGLYWAPLGAPQPRLMPRSALVRTAAPLDQRTPEGWVLAHSTATSLP